MTIQNKASPDVNSQLAISQPVSTLSKESTSASPSFDKDATSKSVSAMESPEEQTIGTKSDIKKKSSRFSFCSCLGNKSSVSKEKGHTIAVPKANLPDVDKRNPLSNISSSLKIKGSLRVPSNDLPSVNLPPISTEKISFPTHHIQDKKQSKDRTRIVVPPNAIKREEEEENQTKLLMPSALDEKQTVGETKFESDISTDASEKQQVIETQVRFNNYFE